MDTSVGHDRRERALRFRVSRNDFADIDLNHVSFRECLQRICRSSRTGTLEPAPARPAASGRPVREERTVQDGGVALQQDSPAGEKIPEQGTSFSLDNSKIEALSKETQELVSLLAGIMADPEPEEIPEVAGPAAPAWMALLGIRYHAPLCNSPFREASDLCGYSELRALYPCSSRRSSPGKPCHDSNRQTELQQFSLTFSNSPPSRLGEKRMLERVTMISSHGHERHQSGEIVLWCERKFL